MSRPKNMMAAARWLTAPARHVALPVVKGQGRGLRVRFGQSTLNRIVFTGEREVEDTLLDLLHRGDVVYDVGANIGWYSLLAARQVGPSGRVVAFEPDLANASYVQRNAATNGLSNVTVVPAAVTDQDGWATLLVKNSLLSRLDKDDDEAQSNSRARRNHKIRETIRGTIPVPVLTLDTWIAQAKQAPPSVIKIDIEGAEIGALRGMRMTLQSAKPTLIIELHGTRDSVLDLLDSFDYEHEPIECDVPTREAPWWAHVLARPRPLVE
jgi:FkbM family methyltransferase